MPKQGINQPIIAATALSTCFLKGLCAVCFCFVTGVAVVAVAKLVLVAFTGIGAPAYTVVTPNTLINKKVINENTKV